MEICLATGIGLLLASFSDKNTTISNWKTKVTATLGFLLSSKMLLRLFLILMVIALVLTRSRMGNAGFMSALVLSLIVALIIMKDLRKVLSWVVVSIIFIDTLVIGQWVGLNKVIERIENTSMTVAAQGKSESVEQRTEPAFGAIVMVKDRLLTGFGAGTFYTAFVPYKPSNIHGYYDHAHNDYIEVLVDTGVIGLLLLISFALGTLYCAITLMQSNKNFHRGVGFGSMLAILSIAIHGIVDFNLHIPANAMTLIALCAVCWALRFDMQKQNVKDARVK
jgi:O-antigen ligase